MIDRQQRDELVASLQGVEELWKEAAGGSVVQNNIIIEILRVADDACQKGLSATCYVFYQELFQVLMDILTPQVWQNLSAGEQAESRHLGLEVLNCAIDALKHKKEIKKEIVFCLIRTLCGTAWKVCGRLPMLTRSTAMPMWCRYPMLTASRI